MKVLLAWENVTYYRTRFLKLRSTLEVKTTGLYPRVHIDAAPVAAVGQAGGVLLTETIRAAGLDRALSQALSRWRKPLAIHDPERSCAIWRSAWCWVGRR